MPVMKNIGAKARMMARVESTRALRTSTMACTTAARAERPPIRR